MLYIVWSPKLEIVGRYDDKGMAARACKNVGAGAFIAGSDGKVLQHHPRSDAAAQRRAERAEKDGRLIPPARPGRAPSVPPPPAEKDRPAVRPAVLSPDYGDSLPQAAPDAAAAETQPPPAAELMCAWAGCTEPRGWVRSNTRPDDAVFCPGHRARARYSRRDGKPVGAAETSPSVRTQAPAARVTSTRLRDAEERYVERHPTVTEYLRALDEARQAARREFHEKVRELGLGGDQADAAE